VLIFVFHLILLLQKFKVVPHVRSVEEVLKEREREREREKGKEKVKK
jgi:hypothetical protein